MSVGGPTLLVLDGHDCSGKTTLALGLARELGVPYVKPFQGEAGEAMLAAAEAGYFARAAALASEQVAEGLRQAQASAVCVLDRHWMTVFTLLPEAHWADWQPLPPTMLCAAHLDTIMERFARRAEVSPSKAWHARYVARYERLAERFGIPALHTDRVNERDGLATLVKWARATLEAHT